MGKICKRKKLILISNFFINLKYKHNKRLFIELIFVFFVIFFIISILGTEIDCLFEDIKSVLDFAL